jgi:hypothetical protein
VAGLVAAAGPARGEVLVWQTYRSDEGRFAVDLPATPSRDDGANPSEVGPVEQRAWKVSASGVELRVEHHDLPRLGVWLLPDSRILGTAVDRMLADRHGRELSREPYTFEDHPGLHVRYLRTDLGDAAEEARFVLVGSRLYIAFARTAADADADAPEQVARFFATLVVWQAED